MIRRPPRSTLDRSSAASDVYKRQVRHRGRVGVWQVHAVADHRRPRPTDLRVGPGRGSGDLPAARAAAEVLAGPVAARLPGPPGGALSLLHL